jgi:predicted MFS family arabinose efflux permease
MSTDARPTPEIAAQQSTRMAFFVAGFAIAAWAPLIPFAQQRLGVDAGTLGLLLLCLGIGSVLAMPITGALAARYGCRLVITVAAAIVCLSLPWLAWASTIPTLAIALCISVLPWARSM